MQRDENDEKYLTKGKRHNKKKYDIKEDKNYVTRCDETKKTRRKRRNETKMI